MIKACIFDLDGTLADTLEGIAAAGNTALIQTGHQPLPKENYKYYAGDGAQELARRALKDAGDEQLKDFEPMYQIYTEYLREYKSSPFPGIIQALQELQGKGILLAVVSNKPHVRTVEVIEKLFPAGLFTFVQGQCDELPRKPDPATARLAAWRMGVQPQECMYFGDTDTDMQTGKRAGMYTVGVLWGFRTRSELEENHADLIIADPGEIAQLPESIGRT